MPGHISAWFSIYENKLKITHQSLLFYLNISRYFTWDFFLTKIIQKKCWCIVKSIMINYNLYVVVTVKSFYFMGTMFQGLIMMDMFVDTWIHRFSNKTHKFYIKLNQHFGWILNLLIVLPKKLNVQRIKMFSQYPLYLLYIGLSTKYYKNIIKSLLSRLQDLSPTCPKFIATQAPLPVTLTDFWLMVCEQGVEVLVALSCDIETGKVRGEGKYLHKILNFV